MLVGACNELYFQNLLSDLSIGSWSKLERLRSGVDPGLGREYKPPSVRSILLRESSSDTCLIVGSKVVWTLLDDLEAFKFEKNPLEESCWCFGLDLGELGKGGKDVMSGDGSSLSCAFSIDVCSLSFLPRRGCGSESGPLVIGAPLGDERLLSPSVGDVRVLEIGEASLGIPRDKGFERVVFDIIMQIQAWCKRRASSIPLHAPLSVSAQQRSICVLCWKGIIMSDCCSSSTVQV